MAGLAVAAAAVIVGVALPGKAATSPWRQVFSHHYGAANLSSGFVTTVAFGPNNVWALGGSNMNSGVGQGVPIIVQWRGRGWTGNVAPSGLTGPAVAVSAISASSIWAVTSASGVVYYNGTRWTLVKQLASPGAGLAADGITAISPRNVWVFGEGGGASGPGVGTWHFDGTTWRHETTAALGAGLIAASAVSASNIWGTGQAATAAVPDQVEHFNGKTWTTVTNPALSGLSFSRPAAFSASNVWLTAVGPASNSPGYLLHYSDHWSRVTIPWGVRAAFAGVTPDGHGGLWFIGFDAANRSYEVHWFPGNKWQRFANGSSVGIGLGAIPGTTSIVATGWAGPNATVWVNGTL